MFKGIAGFKNTITHISVDNTKALIGKKVSVLDFSFLTGVCHPPDLPAAYYQTSFEGQMRLYPKLYSIKNHKGLCWGGG